MPQVIEESAAATDAESTPESFRREITTAPSERSIWTSHLDETTFRKAAVDLALTTSECPWDADIGLPPLPGAPCIDDYVEPPHPEPAEYILSEQIEHRLANDLALIAASKEAVFSVTAACIGERADTDGHLIGLKLWLAANEGVSEELKGNLTEIWDSLSGSTSEAETVENVFTKIVRLNRLRIYQRVRKAVGHPPIFREKGRTRTNPDDKLWKAFTRMLKSHTKGSVQRLTEQGHELVRRGLALNIKLLAVLESLSVDEIEHGSDDALQQLANISKDCFNLTTDGGRVSFKVLLVECGLDARLWLRSKYIGEVDKIGAYSRMALSLLKIHRHISRRRPQNLPPITLEIEGVRPYVSVTKEPSIQGRPMSCYVHAEVQLITHLAQQEPRAANASSPAQYTRLRQPRFIGASKNACFLCFLFLSCYGGPKSPATHGRLYDQWTVPDLAEYTPDQAEHLRHAIQLMHTTMVSLRGEYCLKKPREHPMTSRVDIDRLSLFSTTSDLDAESRESKSESQDDRKHLDRSAVGLHRSGEALREADYTTLDTSRRDEEGPSPQEDKVHGLRALFERLWVKSGPSNSASR